MQLCVRMCVCLWSEMGMADSNFNVCIDLAEFLFKLKLKVTLIVTGLAWSNMGVSF